MSRFCDIAAAAFSPTIGVMPDAGFVSVGGVFDGPAQAASEVARRTDSNFGRMDAPAFGRPREGAFPTRADQVKRARLDPHRRLASVSDTFPRRCAPTGNTGRCSIASTSGLARRRMPWRTTGAALPFG